MRRPAPRLGRDVLAHEEPELDAHAGESDPLAARLRARRDVVIPGQLASSHAGAIVDDGERPVCGRRAELDARRARVERVGDDLGQDRLLERTGIGVAKVLEEMQQVDTGLAHIVPLEESGDRR